MSALFTQCPGDTVQTGTGKVDPAWKFKCTTAARAQVTPVFLGYFRTNSQTDRQTEVTTLYLLI